MQKGARKAMKYLGKLPTAFQLPHGLQRPEKSEVRKRCYMCDRKQDRKTQTVCGRCENHVCEEHFHILCDNCLDIEDSAQENDENQEVEDEDMEEETSSE
jgi:hypothetical protein